MKEEWQYRWAKFPKDGDEWTIIQEFYDGSCLAMGTEEVFEKDDIKEFGPVIKEPGKNSIDSCPLCKKAEELAAAEYAAGGSPQSLPVRCNHPPVNEAYMKQQQEVQAAKDAGLAYWFEWGGMKTAPKVDNTKFGPHNYPGAPLTSDCEYGCGCWMGQCRSGGKVDPFGPCPNNPIKK